MLIEVDVELIFIQFLKRIIIKHFNEVFQQSVNDFARMDQRT